MERSWTFTKPQIGILLACASPDLTRPNLNVVAFDIERGQVFGTNGHVAVRYGTGHRPQWTKGSIFALVTIMRASLAAAHKVMRKTDRLVVTITTTLVHSPNTNSFQRGADVPTVSSRVLERGGEVRTVLALEVGAATCPPYGAAWPTRNVTDLLAVGPTAIAAEYLHTAALLGRAAEAPVGLYLGDQHTSDQHTSDQHTSNSTQIASLLFVAEDWSKTNDLDDPTWSMVAMTISPYTRADTLP
jgi:hypothetical protein